MNTSTDIDYSYCYITKTALKAAERSEIRKLSDKYNIPVTEIERWQQQLSSRAKAASKSIESLNRKPNLRNQIALLRTTLEASPNGILATDLEQNVITFNQKCVEIWDLPQQVTVEGKMGAAMPHILKQVKDPHQFQKKIEEIYAVPGQEISQIIELKDDRFIKWHSVPYRSGEQIIGRVATFSDITEYKRKEKKISHFAKLLQSINANVNEGILRSTPEDGLIYVNDAFVEIFGYDSQEEVLATDLSQFYANTDVRNALMEKLKNEKQFKNEEVLFKRKDGSTFWGLENSKLDESSDGTYIDGVITHIDSRKKSRESTAKKIT